MAISKVILNSDVQMDITDTTAEASDVASGKYFYTAAGAKVQGTGGGGGRLPSGYTEVEYIEATGTQYVFVDLPDTKTTIECTFQMTAAASANEAVYGSNEFFFFRRNTGGYRAATSVGYYDFAADSSNGVHTIFQVPTGAILTYSTSPAIGTMAAGNPTTYLALFGYSSGTGVSFLAKARIYSFRQWSGTTLTRDFVPAKNSSDAAGFYDLVSGIFKQSLVGAFVAGPTV